MDNLSIARGLTHRLSVIGLPTYIIRPFVSDIVLWYSNSGPEWAISRLKSLKVDLFRVHSDLDPLSWVKKNRKNKWSGSIGMIFNYSFRSKKSFSRSLHALMAYSYFVSPKLTERQFKKFKTGVNASPLSIPPDLVKRIQSVTRTTVGGRTIDRSLCTPLLTFRGSPSKKAPIWREKSVVQSEELHKELLWFDEPYHDAFYQEFIECYVPAFIGTQPFNEYEKKLNNTYFATVDFNPKSTCAGEVHFLQEPGFKARCIASPFRIHQLASKPLGDSLYDILKELPWDCTHDQSKAIPAIQSALSLGKTVHSVDLSSATDNFPLELQLVVLRSIYGQENIDVKLFSSLSRCYYKSERGDINWTKGQPLGLYPSFASFGLTHGLLLLALANGDYHEQFYVVGDDVIILEKELYDSYIQVLEQLECPWSTDKTLVSKTIAEFASRVITFDGIYFQFKWRKLSNNNFMDVCRNLGARSYSLLTQRQKRIFNAFKHFLPPFGLNFSKPGSDLVQAVLDTEMLLSRISESRVGSLVDLKSEIDRKVYLTSTGFGKILDFRELERILSAFDEKVRRVFKNTVFSNLVEKDPYYVKGVHDILEALSLKRELPTPLFTPSFYTQLDEFEKLLKLVSPKDRQPE